MVDATPQRVRGPAEGIAGPLELAAVPLVVIATWRLTLGWNWSPVLDPSRHRTTAPQSSLDWALFALVVLCGIGWLAVRGRAVAGTLAVCVPVALLSGWRMAASAVVAWPISLASLIFSLCVMALVATGLGAWIRHSRA